jgi:hypothetical protein
MQDSGHEAVGQALLISAVSIGALGVASLTGHIVHSVDLMIAALG